MIKFYNKTVIGIVLIALLQSTVVGLKQVNCTNNLQYFDTTTMKCTQCSSGMKPNGTACICKEGFIYDYTKQMVKDWIGFVTADNTESVTLCVQCDTCKCTSQQALNYYLENGQNNYPPTCLACASNAYPSSDGKYCVPCPLQMIYDQSSKSCKCQDSNQVLADNICILNTDLTTINTLSSEIAIFGDKQVKSKLYTQFYAKSAYACSKYKDMLQCQIFANLCVLQLYLKSTTICGEYLKKQSGQEILDPANKDENWKKNYPWIYYSTAYKYDFQDKYKAHVSLYENSNDGIHVLPIFIVIYNLEGQLENIKLLGTELQLCPNSVQDGINQRRFGLGFNNECTINLQSYVIGYQLKFFELLIKDQDGIYKPIPVYIKNTNLVVTRFFIIDNKSGIPVDTTSSSSARRNLQTSTTTKSSPTYIRYASSIKLNIQLQKDKVQSMYMPYVIIEYTEKANDAAQLVNSKAQFKTQYSFDSTGFYDVAEPLFIVVNVIVGLIWFLKWYIWATYNPENPRRYSDNYFFYLIFNVINILIENWSIAMFYFLFVMTGYWFTFYKFQMQAFIILPSVQDQYKQYYPFDCLIYIMFSFNTASVLYMVYRQTIVDLFFIDWERSKPLSKDYLQQFQIQQYQNEEHPQQMNFDTGLSVWRTLFVANEFNELSVIRNVNLEWSLFFVGFFLSGLQWENLSAETPHMEVTGVDKISKNYMLKYFLNCFVYLCIGLVQIIVRKLFWIWIPTQVQEFQDLCCISNISIFILDEELHGFYLHGRSPAGIAEGNGLWLDKMLEMEGKTGNSRGLMKGDELQIFEICIPFKMRDEYDTMFKEQYIMHHFRAVGNQMLTVNKPVPANINHEQIEICKQRLQELLKKYLTDIETHSVNHIIEKNIWLRLFGWPPVDPKTMIGLPFFYKDIDYAIEKIFYVGNEFKLLLFNIINFCFFDKLFDSTLVAIICVYVIDKIIEYLRDWSGSRNISSKTLIDDKFLI